MSEHLLEQTLSPTNPAREEELVQAADLVLGKVEAAADQAPSEGSTAKRKKRKKEKGAKVMTS